MLEDERNRQRNGVPSRDLSGYSEWRTEAPDEVVSSINFYSEYLIGQTNGFGEALTLIAIRTAFDIDGTPREEWPEMTHRILLIHNETSRVVSKKREMRKRNG